MFVVIFSIVFVVEFLDLFLTRERWLKSVPICNSCSCKNGNWILSSLKLNPTGEEPNNFALPYRGPASLPLDSTEEDRLSVGILCIPILFVCYFRFIIRKTILPFLIEDQLLSS